MEPDTRPTGQLNLFDPERTTETAHPSPPPTLPAVTARPLPEYVLHRSRRKTIGLTLRDAQLHVHAPSWVSRDQIEDVIRQKTPWIQKKLAIQQDHLILLALQDTQWRPGGHIPYLGAMIRLTLDGTAQTRLQDTTVQPGPAQELILALPEAASNSRIQELAQGWMQIQAAKRFKHRLQHYLDLADQRILSWGLSGAQSRWGSCSGQRRIRLNWRLIHLPPALIDYVIAHEVAHLKEMNHSPAFWHEVARLYPDYKQARDTLKQHHPATLQLL